MTSAGKAGMASYRIESFDEVELLDPTVQMVDQSVTIANGQNLVRGSVLGRITASGKYVLSVAAANDGSQVPRAVMLHDLVTTADTVTGVAVGGAFIAPALVLGAGHTIATVRAAFEDTGRYVSDAS
jgi:hypothetical protein